MSSWRWEPRVRGVRGRWGSLPNIRVSKAPSLYGGQTDGNSGMQATLSTHPPNQPTNPLKSPNTHTHTHTHTHKHTFTHINANSPTSIRKLFFFQLLQSHATASFTATICPQSAHARCESFVLSVSIDCMYLKQDCVTFERGNDRFSLPINHWCK